MASTALVLVHVMAGERRRERVGLAPLEWPAQGELPRLGGADSVGAISHGMAARVLWAHRRR